MTNVPSGPSVESITDWIAHEEAALEAIRIKLRPLLEQEHQIADRLARLKDLLSAYVEPDTSPSPATPAPQPLTFTRVARPQSVAERVRGQVREILATSAKPMHIHEIHAAFEQRNWEVPGAGTPANITAHLSQAPDIISPTRGFYRLLAEDETPPAKKRAAKSKRIRRRRNTDPRSE